LSENGTAISISTPGLVSLAPLPIASWFVAMPIISLKVCLLSLAALALNVLLVAVLAFPFA
jgi:hypothetical protein